MTKQEKRGLKTLTAKPSKPVKHHHTCWVHYESMGGELLAFEVIGGLALMRECYAVRPRLAGSYTKAKKDPKARAIVLSSEQVPGQKCNI